MCITLMKRTVCFIVLTLTVALTLVSCGSVQPARPAEKSYEISGAEVYWLGSRPSYGSSQTRRTRIYGADPLSFKGFYGSSYSADKSYVYYLGQPVPFAESSSFVALQNGYGRDSRGAYFMDRPVESADSQSFRVPVKPWPHQYALDESDGYYFGKAMELCDPGSFKLAKKLYLSTWSSDDRCVYYRGQKLEGADAATISFMNANYALDGSRVFYRSEPVDGAIPSSFKRVRNSTIDARDKEHCYTDGQTVDCDSGERNSLFDKSPAAIYEEQSERISSIFETLRERKKDRAKQALSNLQKTLSRVVEMNQGNVLSPEIAAVVDLQGIQLGDYYQLISRIDNSDNSTFIVAAVNENSLQFDVFIRGVKGVVPQVVRFDGDLVEEVSLGSSIGLYRSYQGKGCRYVIGNCTEEFTNHYLTGSVTQGSRTVFTEFSDGLWTTTTTLENGVMETRYVIADKNGFPLYIAQTIGDSLSFELMQELIEEGLAQVEEVL